MKGKSFFAVFILLLLMSFSPGVQYQRGDVNYDGQVNIADVTCLIDYLLQDTWPNQQETVDITVNGVSFKMVAVEGGTFLMGATGEQGSDQEDKERPVHQVTLSSYRIGETEVTQELWLAVMGSNPSDNKDDINNPVEEVSWYDCYSFISKLNNLTGMNFRFPTEAEWEFAARGGNKTKGFKYSGSDTINNVAWCVPNAGSKTHPVATKNSNELGLYDMSGNVMEWCGDYYGAYSSSPQTNPTGPSNANSSFRVERGGHYATGAKNCRVSYRTYQIPENKYSTVGLRLAM